MTKYGFEISQEEITKNINRLTNQMWKLIPMKENEENWQLQLNTVIIEIAGLNEILKIGDKYLTLLSKLEGINTKENIEFSLYRKTVFEAISLLREI
jgi:hypothetical protein